MSSDSAEKQRKATGRDIILTIGRTMHEGLEPLLDETLAPSLYQVYLHADDHQRLRSVFDRVRQQARKHLDDQIDQLNRPAEPSLGRLGRALGRTVESRKPEMTYRSTEGTWHIQFELDPDGDLGPGDVRVVTDLAVGEETRYGSGSKTHRIISTTRRLGEMKTEIREREEARLGDPGKTKPISAPLARFHYEDDSGAHVYEMRNPQIVIGRRAEDVWVDIDLDTALDVSREHARVKHENGSFRIKDLSTYGTTVNGRLLRPSMDTVDGSEKDLDLWEELPDGARIELASLVTLTFEVVEG